MHDADDAPNGHWGHMVCMLTLGGRFPLVESDSLCAGCFRMGVPRHSQMRLWLSRYRMLTVRTQWGSDVFTYSTNTANIESREE